MIRVFLDILLIIINPRYWLMNNKYSEKWDKYLNELMDKHTFILDGNYHAKLGDISIWIENHPYASFTIESSNFILGNPRPSRLTIIKAKRKLDYDLLDIDKKRDFKLKKIGI